MDEVLFKRTLSCLNKEKYFNTKLILPTCVSPFTKLLKFFSLEARP